jgi:hypothetical protein
MEPGLAEVRVPKWFMVSNIQVMQPTSTERTVTMNTYDRRRVVGSRKHNRIMKTVLAAVVTLLAAAALGAPPAHADPDPNPPPIIPTPGGVATVCGDVAPDLRCPAASLRAALQPRHRDMAATGTGMNRERNRPGLVRV